MAGRINSWNIDQSAGLERLESRTLLSATLSSKGTLVAEGTSGNDAIVISRDPQRTSKILVSIGGSGTKFNAASVKRIEMYGDGGADRLTLDDSLGIISARGASLYGGDGNDTLVGGLAGATFDGGNDDDSILGSSKADLILGQSGKDTLIGGKGDDKILGGFGNDVLYGSAGNDQLYGDAGNDSVFGEEGTDTLAGDGEDQLWFKGLAVPGDATGNDSLNGGANGTKHTITIADPVNYVIQGATDPDNGDLITITYT